MIPWRSAGGGWLGGGGRDSLEKSGMVDGWEVRAAIPWRSAGGGWLGRGSPDSLEKAGWWMAGTWEPRLPGDTSSS